MAAEAHLALPLLNNDRDEEIISQLLSTNERPRPRRCNNFHLTRKRCGAIAFIAMLLFGFMSSLWTAASCKLVLIDWNPGGVELTVRGVGLWRYNQQVVNGTQVANYCVPYDGTKKVHKEINLDGFFPDDKALQAYSLLSPSTAFVSLIALMVFITEIKITPEILSGTIRKSVDPMLAIRAAAFAGVMLVIGGIFQLVATFQLLHYKPASTTTGYQSPICNPSYSHCKLGPVGVWSVFGALTLIVAGIISFHSARRVAKRHGKWKLVCC